MRTWCFRHPNAMVVLFAALWVVSCLGALARLAAHRWGYAAWSVTSALTWGYFATKWWRRT